MVKIALSITLRGKYLTSLPTNPIKTIFTNFTKCSFYHFKIKLTRRMLILKLFYNMCTILTASGFNIRFTYLISIITLGNFCSTCNVDNIIPWAIKGMFPKISTRKLLPHHLLRIIN